MPNVVLHTVWNVSPSLAIGDNPLYETSFDEWIGAGDLDKYRKSPVKSRILQYAKGSTKSWLNDIVDQIDETISKHKITDL